MQIETIDFAPPSNLTESRVARHLKQYEQSDTESVHSFWGRSETISEQGNNSHAGSRWQNRAKYLDLISAVISFGCLVVSLVLAWSSNKTPTIGVNREMILYSQKPNVTTAIRLFQSTYNQYCDKYAMRQYKPTWFSDNSNFTGTAMHTSVHAGNFALWPLVIWVYAWSSVFQYWRYYMASRAAKGQATFYKPDGPELSRWVEYFFTSPFQIMIVSLSFGFASLDTIIGHAALQAALVLFGYDIEQQIKKIYKGRSKQKFNFQHAFPFVHNVRVPLYLFVTWLIHFIIWGFPFAVSWGIGGKYYLQKDHNKQCEQNADFEIPFFVDLIFWGQFLSFSAFGFVCTLQTLRAKPLPPIEAKVVWIKYSFVYSFLSITAKTLLEVGFLGFVSMYKPWKQINDVSLNAGACPSLPPVSILN